MIKLTQKEYIALLSGTHFIQCCNNVTIEDILHYIATIDITTLPIIYKVDKVQLRSKDMVMHYSNHLKDGLSGKSYRHFHGKNEYYREDDLLIHKNIQDDYVSVFLNM